MTATDATDYLGKKLESFFFGGKIREGESGVGLDDADGCETGKVEPASKGLSPN